MSDKILTVIVPSYNMEKYLPKCLGSLVVVPELMEKLEVLVVNDGSKDRTSEIAHEFEAKYPQTFRVVDKANGHYGSCVNTGLKIANGAYTRVLDADDYAETDAFSASLNRMVELCKNNSDIDLYINNYNEVNPSGGVISKSDYKFISNKILGLDDLGDVLNTFIGLHSIAYRTQMLRNMGYKQTEGCAYTDMEWFIIPMANVKKVFFLPEYTMNYVLGREGQSMAVSLYYKSFDVVLKITKNILSWYKTQKHLSPPNKKDYVYQKVLRITQDIFRNAIIGSWNERPHVDLVDFDRFVSLVSDTLYKDVEMLYVPIKSFKFKFVSEWRRARSLRTFRFAIFSLFVRLSKVVKKVH